MELIQFTCGTFVVLALSLALAQHFTNSRPRKANAEADVPAWQAGPLTSLIYKGAVVSVVLLLSLEHLRVA